MKNQNKAATPFIDLFAGIGGFRHAIQNAGKEAHSRVECVFSSEIDKECQKVYRENFGDTPHGDITEIPAESIPDHDILLAGFPCQPFSIIGNRKGFEDTRGTLFFDIARIIQAKKPAAFVLENVKLLVGHNQGKTFKRILETLAELGYDCHWRALNALDFGLPQKRERVFIAGFKKPCRYEWPEEKIPMRPLADILEKNVPEKFYASEHIRQKRLAKQKPTKEITVWHENKAGHISAYPFSCALRAGASHNYLLVNGERRLTPREMLRLQGFPEDFKIMSSYTQTRKQAGNSLPVPAAQAVIRNVMRALGREAGFVPDFPCEKENKR
ncbi:Modification methylase NgoBI [Candidatus Desulfarcum epimagneticum]|uniref:Cytosine-specific methyltransferase n=1 Tax=uncultured Desulfobacteraceae bacterium TaxID=218296 RepID=A0A484HJH6_9BACT|nr:Modification methylase NgoBI [uncultured Desulfobacteraceae bacterium]